MAPRLMVMCLGGLAGAGALVCCELDAEEEVLDAGPDADGAMEHDPVIEGEPEPAPIH